MLRRWWKMVDYVTALVNCRQITVNCRYIMASCRHMTRGLYITSSGAAALLLSFLQLQILVYRQSNCIDLRDPLTVLMSQLTKLLILLIRAFSRIYVLLDIQTSRSLLSLYSIIIYFINNKGQYRSFLLSILELIGRYTGVNITNSVAVIIAKFNISDRISYFILDNVLNNNTYIQALGKEFNFNQKECYLYYASYIINLIA